MCLRKTRYRNDHEAMRVARRIKEQRGTGLRAYECEACGGWHLTKGKA
jgi:hypothetical protein